MGVPVLFSPHVDNSSQAIRKTAPDHAEIGKLAKGLKTESHDKTQD